MVPIAMQIWYSYLHMDNLYGEYTIHGCYGVYLALILSCRISAFSKSLPSSHPWTFQPKKIEPIASSNHLISSHKSISPQRNNISLRIKNVPSRTNPGSLRLLCFFSWKKPRQKTIKFRSTLPNHPFTKKLSSLSQPKKDKNTKKNGDMFVVIGPSIYHSCT